MAGLLSSTITTLCVHSATGYNMACDKALDAGTQQSGIRQQADQIEDYNMRRLNKGAENSLGRDTSAVIAFSAIAASTIIKRRVVTKLPPVFWCHDMKIELTPEVYVLNLNWHF